MNKNQLIEAVSEESGLTRGQAKNALEAIIKTTSSVLEQGDKITLTGFGTFVVERKKARTGRDPRNGAPIKIAAKKVVKFRPGLELSEKIR